MLCRATAVMASAEGTGCCAQGHYTVSAALKRQIRAAQQRMVEAGRLESVPNHPSLYRLGGVIRQLSQEAGVDWPRSKPGSGLLDPRVLLRSLDLQGRRLP